MFVRHDGEVERMEEEVFSMESISEKAPMQFLMMSSKECIGFGGPSWMLVGDIWEL